MVHPTATIAAFCLLVGTTIAQQSCVIDLAFTVDVSGSIQDTDVAGETPNWQRVTTFMVDVIQGLDVRPDGVRVAVVTFGNRGILEFNLNTHNSKAQVRQAANNTRYAGGNTNTTGGLKVTYESVFSNTTSGNRPNVPDVILLITDGRPTRDREFLQTEVDRIKNANIRIIGIGVTNQVNETLMLGLVTDKNTDYFNVSRFQDLSLLLSRILNQACRTLAPPSTTPTTTPITTTTVTQPAPPPGCASRADVYLLLDGSGSISANNFNIMKLFTSTLIQDLSIDDGRIRLGMALFSTNVLNQFGLVQFNNRVDMIAAVNSAAYPMGTTNTAEAIRYVRQTGFSNGDRGDVPNILVIFTDGNSNDRQATLREAFLAKAAGIHILTIGIGDWTNVYELQSVASYPYQKNYIAIPRFSGLNDALKNRLRNLLCDNVNECSSNPCQRGNCINGIDMYLCNCPSGWGGRNCERSCRVGNDVVFALDSSGSIGEANFRRELDFVRDVVYGLNLNQARIGVLEYANNPAVQFQLNRFSNTMDILNALSMFYMAGTTNTAGAIAEMRNSMFTSANGDRVNNNNVGVVITDGRSNDFAQTWAQARQARDNNDIRMVAVGIGSNVNQLELEAIASFPNGPNVIRANSFTSLSSITEQLLGAVCNDVNECNSNPCQNGECVDLLSGYRCACNVGFSGRNCERRCNYQYDIILVIDASGSIRNTRFRDVLELAVSIVSDFQVSAATAKFGALIFSDNPQVRFQLNSYTSKQDVITAIRASQYIGGRTNIASALETVQNQMFTSNNGDRSNVQNHVIIITDGASTLRVGQAVPTAITMRVAGVKISVIGVGMDANTLELRGMASEPLSRMLMMAPSMTDVMNNQNLRNNIVNGIVGSTCDSVNECNSNPCQNGASCINDLHRYICNCNPDWTGLNCNRRCTNQMDVTFVLDFSGSLDNVFNIVIAFAREVTLGLPVELNRARVAVVTYASDASVSFLLNAYNSKEEILNALSFSRNGGRTNTQSALSLLYTDVFVANRGDRNGVRNVAIVVTDGGSNIRRDQTINRANDARNNGIDIYVAAFGEAPDLGEVNGISSNPDSQYVIRINNANSVQSAASTLLNDLCQ